MALPSSSSASPGALRPDCPEIQPHAHLYVRALHRACEKAGGIDPLARALGVRPEMLTEWLEGAAPVPQAIFLKAVDVLA
jgi:hypothetical protein